ncbi:MAG: GNAT family N-acetyltransferase [Methyloligellaceae bacterium]
MSDLLVSLYNKNIRAPQCDLQGIEVRRAIAPERHLICEWVSQSFGEAWASEVAVAFSGLPVTTWIAVREQELLGFACHDATARGFFGPTGVSPSARGQGLGRELLLATLSGMREAGYAYAVIGGVGGQRDYYAKIIDVYDIPDSTPGIYAGMLRTVK